MQQNHIKFYRTDIYIFFITIMKIHSQALFSSFSPFLLFYSRKNIKHSENIFHILRAIQNILHGFSSWVLFFFFLTYPSIQWRFYMHNYKNKTYKLGKGRKNKPNQLKHEKQTKQIKQLNKLGEGEGQGKEKGLHNRERQRERLLERREKRSNTSYTCKVSRAPVAWNKSRAAVFLGSGSDENVQSCKGCPINCCP